MLLSHFLHLFILCQRTCQCICLNKLPHGSVLKYAFLDVHQQNSLCTNTNWCSNVNSLALKYGLHLENIPYNCETKKHVKYVVKETLVSNWHVQMRLHDLCTSLSCNKSWLTF